MSDRPKRVKIGGNLYHPQLPEGAVKVTRPGRWGNPFRVAEHGLAGALQLFEDHVAAHPELVARARRELAGKDLACWCGLDQRCHGDIWLRIANNDGKGKA